jgi:alpha-galactosidase
MKFVHACTPIPFSRTLLAISIVCTVAPTGAAHAQPKPDGSPAAAPRTFGEVVNPARSSPAGAGVFREAVAALADGMALPPLAFRLGDQTQVEFLARARRTQATRADPAGTVHDFTYEDPTTKLTCRLELLEFRDFPAIEWVAHFTNGAAAALPLLTEVAALDLTWHCPGEAFVYRAPGANETSRDFQFQREPLQTIRAKRGNLALRAGSEGRSSVDWLPFFNLQSGDDGLIVALGWTGQWYAQIDRDGPQARLRAGMEGLRLALQPGETIRTPRILLLHWRGQPLDGQNQLRRLLLRHHTPQIAGRPVEIPACYGAWGGSPTPIHVQQLALIQEKKLPYDCYWIDAGWYGTSDKPCPNVFQGDWGKTGNWCVNRNYHPDGLKPLSAKAHAAGMQFLLWVEPERARHGAPVTLEHPEWFLQQRPGHPRQEGESLILNLGHPPARQWAIDLISGLIQDNGLDWYRQDFNISPLEFWRVADAPDRQGLTEIRYIEGLYAFWDELLRRHPGLRIDNCASGGRRLDLETLSRSIPLWRDDYNCFPNLEPEIVQVHGFGLTHWLPLHATSPFNSVPGDTYRFRSVVAPGVVFGLDEGGNVSYDEQTYPWDWHRKMLAEVRRARPFWYGDLYPLTSCSTAPDAWIALQLHRPDQNAGVILAFRRAASPVTTADFRLGGILPAMEYTFEDADSGAIWTVAGQTLAASGLPFAIGQPRSSRLVFYTCASKEKPE